MAGDVESIGRVGQQSLLQWTILGAFAVFGSQNVTETHERIFVIEDGWKHIRRRVQRSRGHGNFRANVKKLRYYPWSYPLPDVNYTTVYRNVKSLEQSLLLMKVKEYRKRGARVFDYDLTGFGLFKVLSYPFFLNEIEKIGNAHAKKLPLLFGKFHFFEEKGILEDVIDIIHFFCGYGQSGVHEKYGYLRESLRTADESKDIFWLEARNLVAKESLYSFRDPLYENVFMFPILNPDSEKKIEDISERLGLNFPRKSAKEWFRILSEDKDIHEYIQFYISKSEDNLRKLKSLVG